MTPEPATLTATCLLARCPAQIMASSTVVGKLGHVERKVPTKSRSAVPFFQQGLEGIGPDLIKRRVVMVSSGLFSIL